jgi:HEAT repeats
MHPVRGEDFDATRGRVASDHMAEAVELLTADVAMRLPPESLGAFKASVKRFFSSGPWGEGDAAELAAVVTVPVEWREHDLGEGITLGYGDRDGRFALSVRGTGSAAPSLFERVFSGPVKPEATPHPRKVRFVFGGSPAPGEWYRRGDVIEDERLERLFAEEDVTDVMVAGDFVTIGLDGPWDDRLDPMLSLVTELFATGAPDVAPERTRAELLIEAGTVTSPSEELHLLDPDVPDHRRRLESALADESSAVRRIAVAILGESADPVVRGEAIRRGLADGTLRVRRTALDAAGDTAEETFRGDFERVASSDPDPWSRWRAVRALGDIGAEASRDVLEASLDDDEFRVRFEAERVLRNT